MRPVETARSVRPSQTRPRRWRAGKVRPIPGNSPHDQPVSRGILPSFWRICDDTFSATVLPWLTRTILGVQYAFSKAWRNLSGPMWFQSQNQTLGRGRAASRWSAPSPGKRTRREDHAPSHRPQMSSGRLFLDRVARQQSPSLLHRHTQNNTHLSNGPDKGDISTLLGRVTFLLCVDNRRCSTRLRADTDLPWADKRRKLRPRRRRRR
jgi:hypothetical protein